MEGTLYKNRIRGCLFGGAVGDALGYPVEFLSEEEICSQYGPEGIRQYRLDRESGRALISDDTQMSLFTAVGLLVGDTRGCMRGIRAWPRSYVAMAYQDWLRTQESACEELCSDKLTGERNHLPGGESCVFGQKPISWLLDVPQLYCRRAPGNTCLDALRGRRESGNPVKDYIAAPLNDSKGCGGIMRIAPLALSRHRDIIKMDYEAAQIAAITHGHSLGYMPAAVLAHIISRIVYPEGSYPQEQTLQKDPGTADHNLRPLRDIVLEARNAAASVFGGDRHWKELEDIIGLSLRLSANDSCDRDNIRQIGQGWVAEETLGIALYCALRHQDDFTAGVIAAVNHEGDSDSTGAVTGNILGALLGYHAIADQWKDNLELADIILEVADDLCQGCRMSEYGDYRDPVWERKYIAGSKSRFL